MSKKYMADVYFFTCPHCKKPNVGKAYYALHVTAEMGDAKRSEKLTYPCSNEDCKQPFPADRVNGEAVDVSKEEALRHGLFWESKAGLA